MSFAVGSLVRARGREWVVLPETDEELVMVRPLGGTDAEITGILTQLEDVAPATFAPPDPEQPGDHRSAQLLRDALRLGFRSSAGPFRSVGHLAVEPRPYQLVPLLMALQQDVVRLLIADDVGIGKTIESALIARELLDQGDITRTCVLCPPHLAEQWQAELAEKFHIEAELVLASTAARLERGLPVGTTIFDVYPHVVVSVDYIKADRRREDFVRACPELVIVDEAHTCADAGEGARGRHQRFELVRSLAADPDRHLVLVTATPHSGKEGAFRSLLSLLDPEFAELPDTLAGDQNRHHRERLARHLVQRRRGDIRSYLEADTRFPIREETELTYDLSNPYRSLFESVLAYARESVRSDEKGSHRMRVRWWSALGLLRALASSPAAAAATMRTRATTADSESAEDADEIGRATVLDLDDVEEAPDVVPGSDTGDVALARRLRAMAKDADALRGKPDRKLVTGAKLVQQLLDDGHNPIVFCRFIETAEYVAEELRARLKKGVEVEAVTGRLPAADREARVRALGQQPRRVLVATDCLSEGINLQDHFTAVIHYDLPWNPTRLEQREGRVDRFGQPADTVRTVTYYGTDNQIDETVLEVLLRKHRAIRGALGVSIPVPGNTGDVIEALAENVLLRQDGPIEEHLPGFDEVLRPATEQLHLEWENALEKEKASRSIFRQASIDPDEVAAELAAMRAAIGGGADVERFVTAAVEAYGGNVSRNGATMLHLAETSQAVRDVLRIGDRDDLKVAFNLPVDDGVTHLGRTHPFVAALAGHTLDEALDPVVDSPARRCGVIRTNAVRSRTHLLVCRFRLNLVATSRGEEAQAMLAEDAGVLAFSGPIESPRWLSPAEAEALLSAAPTGNVVADQARDFLREAVAGLGVIRAELEAEAHDRASRLEAAHRQARESDSRATRVRYTATPQLPVDVLGLFVYLPGAS